MARRHDDAYRRRAGMIGALASCCCTWPLDVEPTSTGHHEACPAHVTLVASERIARIEAVAARIEAKPYPDDASVWSVGVTLEDGRYVGFAAHDERLIPEVIARVRAKLFEVC